MDNTLDHLQHAAVKLSQGGSVKGRLAEAYASHLIEIDVDDLPESVRNEFGALCNAMRRERPLPRESAIRASVRKMSNDEAGRYAALVVRIFAALARANVPVANRRAVRAVAAAPIFNLFAAEG